MDQAAKGKKALESGNFEDAVALYSSALAASPTSPDYLIQRSTALQRAGKPADALMDAENAVLQAQKRARREAIVSAQFRRGCSLYSLERYGDADFVFAVVKRMDEKHKMIDMWVGKTAMSLKKLSEDDERKKCSVKETPQIIAPLPGASGAGATNSGMDATANPASRENGAQESITQTPAEKIRHEWYQNADSVFITLLAKGVPKDKTHIDIQERSLNMAFPLSNGSSYDFTLEPLFDSVVPQASVSRVTPFKVEFVLSKASKGRKWTSLEGEQPLESQGDAKGAELDARGSMAPNYPTSSRNGPKDWDKVTRDAQEQLRDPSKKGTVQEDDDFEGGDEANFFFQKLFKDASPDVRRAMMKSYTESNGTSLSTNWEEVKKAKVETLPPDGMEAKQWSS